MRKVLIVSPRFPPKNAPDVHRVRMSLRYYRQYGWEPTILCLTPASSDSVDDPMLLRSVPADIKVVRVAAWSEEGSRRFGFGHLDYRCLFPVYRAGSEVLRNDQYDVVFFSTTVFLTFLLGPLWKKCFGCSIVFDFQDPWRRGGGFHYTRGNVPGTWWKYKIGQLLSDVAEPFAMKSADHIIAVSDGYVRALVERYRWLSRNQCTVIPFGVDKSDLEFVRSHKINSKIFSLKQGTRKWVYAGRGGPDMNAVLRAFFEQLSLLRRENPAALAGVRIYFVGTNYSPSKRTAKVIEPLAAACGVGDMIEEHSERISYYETLSLYKDSDAILLIGSESADYVPSKLFNCALSGRPILAIFHRESFLNKIASSIPNIFVGSFGEDMKELGFMKSIKDGLQWLCQPATTDSVAVERAVEPWLAEGLTQIQCAIFDRVRQSKEL